MSVFVPLILAGAVAAVSVPTPRYFCSAPEFRADIGIVQFRQVMHRLSGDFFIETEWPEGAGQLRILDRGNTVIFEGPAISMASSYNVEKSTALQTFVVEDLAGFRATIILKRRSTGDRLYLSYASESDVLNDIPCALAKAKKKKK